MGWIKNKRNDVITQLAQLILQTTLLVSWISELDYKFHNLVTQVILNLATTQQYKRCKYKGGINTKSGKKTVESILRLSW